ncbi:MAG TPA: flagellar hook-basal body protein [Desulfitobacteriaceae bacterium]|nr:flagellar hook-basal body protein [Desulfitobacteriaceae bacterium]
MRLIGTGASGIRAQQLALDTVANNLANVNTMGFKSGRPNFAETLAVIVRSENAVLPIGAMVPEALSVGSGVAVNGVGTDFNQGNMITTDNVWDLSIQGEGFFQVALPSGETAYTRAGSFKLNANGQLVDGQGNFLAVRIPQETTDIAVGANGEITGTISGSQRIFGYIGSVGPDGQTPYAPPGPYTVDISGRLVDGNGTLSPAMLVVPQEATGISVGKDGVLTGLIEEKPQVFGQVTLAGFSNPEGLTKIGDNLFAASVNSGNVQVSLPGQNSGIVYSNFLEQSNVDMASAMTDLIQAQRAYQLNSRMVQDGNEMWGLANAIRR